MKIDSSHQIFIYVFSQIYQQVCREACLRTRAGVGSGMVTWGHLMVCGQQRTIFLGMENNLSLSVYFHYIKKK